MDQLCFTGYGSLAQVFVNPGHRIKVSFRYKLHGIRQGISNKRFLTIFASSAYPAFFQAQLANHAPARMSLFWWFATRAAVHEDICFNIEKRKPMVVFCFLAEAWLITLTLAAIVIHGKDYVILCYAVAYGIMLGFATVVFLYMGSEVNALLTEGTQRVRDMVDARDPTTPDSCPVRTPWAPSRQDHELLDHAKVHELRLSFLGLNIDENVWKACATPLGGFAIAILYGILKQALGPIMGSLE